MVFGGKWLLLSYLSPLSLRDLLLLKTKSKTFSLAFTSLQTLAPNFLSKVIHSPPPLTWIIHSTATKSLEN